MNKDSDSDSDDKDDDNNKDDDDGDENVKTSKKEQETNFDSSSSIYSSSTDIYADDIAQNDDINDETTMILDTNTYFFDNDDESSQIRRSNDNGDEIITTRKNRHLINGNNEDRRTQNDEQNEKIDVADDDEDDENDEEEEDNTEKYMNDEEGTGGREVMSRDETSRNLGKSYSRHKNNSYRNKFSNKSQKLEGQKDVRFFDDEDDDDEDDDDDDEDEENNKDGDRHLEGSGGNFNDDNSRNNDDEDDNAFFALKRKSNKYFRKNTNDAIKIISTPHGKVGIVYQQTPNTDKNVNLKDKSMQPEQTDSSSSQNRDKFLSQKITPVLTADGKVALLYRGDSENTKYEPILNLTHAFNAIGKDNYDNKTSAVNNNAKVFDNDNDRNDGGVADRKIVVDVGSNGNHHHHPHPHQPVNHLHNHHHHHYHHNSVSNNDSSRSSSVSNISINSDNDMSTIKEDNHDLRPKFFEPDDSQKQEHQQYQYSSMSTSLSLNPLPDNNPILPIINRPLSEVLGIKKNQFRQFRIKDTSTEPTQKTIQTTPNNYVNYAQYTTTNFRQQQIPAVRSSTNFDTREFDDRISKYNQLDTGILRSESTNQHQHQQNEQNQHKEHDLDETQSLSSSSSITSSSSSADILGKTEVINLAIIPHFDEEFERQQRYHELENTNHRHYKQRHRYRHLNEDLSGVHCAMQAMMGVAAISTVFGMLGAFFKQRILDQIRMMHW